MDSDTQPLRDTCTSPLKKRTPDTMGHLMTPVRRIFLRLEWSRSSKKRKGTTKTSASTYQGPLRSISEKSPMLSPQDASMTSPLRTPEQDSRPFKTVLGLGARRDADSSGDRDYPRIFAPITTATATTTPLRRPTRLAIQQEDTSFDAIVVTTLPRYPFCCHEELLNMSREELFNVARALNSRLPAISQIPVDEWVPQGLVRERIELLVGIRPPVPMAPKAVKCAQPLSAAMDVDVEDDSGDGILPSPPSSPLAFRAKRRGISGNGRVAVALPSRIPRRRGHSQGNDNQEEEHLMSGVVEGACISPRRFLEPLDEESEPSSEGGAMVRLYEGSDTDHSVASLDMLDGNSAKRRKVSDDGRYAKVFSGRASFSPRSPSVLGSLSKSPLLPDSQPRSLQPTLRYKFSVRRKPVMKAFHEKAMEAAPSPSIRMTASNSIDMLFNGGPMAPSAEVLSN